MPRVKPEYKAERRADILAAARVCFVRHGFHRTTLQDVFAQAGLSAGCVYNYFRSKDDLILAIAEERHDAESRAIAESLELLDPIEGLRLVAKTFIALYLTGGGLDNRRIAVQTWSESQLNRDVLASVREGLDGPRGQLAKLIARAQAQGRITKTLGADAIARSLIALFHGFVLQKLWEPDYSVKQLRIVFEHFLQSLIPRPKS
jgi:AcrR family transcriptional regulator